jgi:signal transduction histidine kinase
LLLVRRVSAEGKNYIQGCWLDWLAIRESLLAATRNLLPRADLQPALAPSDGEQTRMLAALPVRLLPGPVPAEGPPLLSAIRVSLLLAWSCVLGAALAAAVLLHGVMSLSHRRATFVSAVTHELRTPLTTFRMYTEMLDEEMVPEGEKRRGYLSTLRKEADRLGHLVENVLAYARLDGNRPHDRLEPIAVGDMFNRMNDRLADRADRGGMQLRFDCADDLPSRRVHADPSAVEQILLNLVDNACKYAAAAADRHIEIRVTNDADRLAVRVADHGPGISRRQARRLFRPFSKSDREAAHSAPGLGLGLALSRRLARNMGGSILLDRTASDGACFVLTLPLS